ncbi:MULTISPECIES: phage shock protein PspA [Acidiphilium]|uniref:Phage shock protein A (PspA) family protein n=1 Tax=Acidiphilium rubrum TaxID=526 RepID=A0A8G2CHP3_ACIRU|nr:MULTISPECIES: phage shock protein PspA [Acidiphilium]OYW00730.1 MAG: phage shock protein PspA [Acidiphilium sp. 37-64-53]OZB28129.1 MAG: phage shock protein PspA [Acidiphilium sp. 34-64-41]SIQ08240.1 phage shock protein A (PspA) family protein [Acidiphilium rubrum]HQT85834.1 phage shock protein PspA [Acidiphilium rubrum]
MGIFSRLSDIVNSNLNALLDRAEDPQKVIRLVIQEMEDTLVEVRSAAVRLIAERREVERRMAALTRDQDEWHRKAAFAVQRGREDLAKAALLAKSRASQAIAEAQGQIEAVQAAIAQQNEDVGKLQAKLDDAKAREKSIVLRQQSATTRLKVKQTLYDERVTDAFARFEQVERNLDLMEGRAEAYDLGRRPAAPTVAEEFAALEANDQVERELAELKSRIKAEEKAA